MSANLPLTWQDKKNSPELEAFLKQYGDEYYMTAEQINQMRDAVNEMAVIQQSNFLGTAEPTGTPTGTGRGYWEVIKSGTYTNFGGVVLGVNERGLIYRNEAGAFSISKVGFIIPAAINKIITWTATAFASGDQVNHLGKDWVANAATVAGDVPGTSSKWVERLNGYTQTLKNYETTNSISGTSVNDLSSNADNNNFGLSSIFAPTDNRVLTEGYVSIFRTKLTNSEVGRKVRFYILRETTALNFTVIYDSGDVPAELNGVNTFKPNLGSVKVLPNDVIGCKTIYISSANSQRFRDSGGSAIATGVNYTGTVAVGSSYTFSAQPTTRKFSIDATIFDLDLLVGKYWGNKANGYPVLDELGLINTEQFPVQISGKVQHIETPITTYRVDLGANAIQRESGGVLTVDNSPGYLAPAGYNSAFANKIIICSPTAQLGFASSGILTEIRVGKNTTVVSTSKIQAWIVRPSPTNANLFSLVEKVGEIDGSVAGRWHIFSGLSIFVKAGDRIAVRGIDVAPSYFSGSTAASPYSFQFGSVLSDLSMDVFSSPLLFPALSTGVAFPFEATITITPIGARNVPGGLLGLNAIGSIPNKIGKIQEMPWNQKKIIWVGTSIPAGMSPSYPKQIGEFLNANLVNESMGSSGIIWDGTRNLSLSATIAELTASFPGWEPQSYQNKLIGKSPDLVVFDHGHNDRLQATGARLGALNSTDRTTFYGAFNYVINALYADNPNVRIAFVTPPNRFTSNGVEMTAMDNTRLAILALADKYAAPVCDLMKLANFNEKNYSLQTGDGTHPTQSATNRIAIILYNFLKGIS